MIAASRVPDGGVPARNAGEAASGAEADVATRMRTKAELEQASGLMEAVVRTRQPEARVSAGGREQRRGRSRWHRRCRVQRPPQATLADDQGQTTGGEYIPQPVRRVDIPKPQGGVQNTRHPDGDGSNDPAGVASGALTDLRGRLLRIELRLSTGEERPSSGQGGQAVCRRRPQGWVVDMDLEKFFDRVNHDLLMEKLSTKIDDARVLRLIRRYLEAGMMADGMVSPTDRRHAARRAAQSAAVEHPADGTGPGTGTPGPRLLPLRGRLQHLRRKQRAGERVMASITRFLAERAQAQGQCGQERGSASVAEEVSGLQPDVAQSPETADCAGRVCKRLEGKIREVLKGARGRSLATPSRPQPDPARLGGVLSG